MTTPLDVVTQGIIQVGVIASAWLTHRVWKGRKEREATKAATSTSAATNLSTYLDDPSTPAGFIIHRQDLEIQRLVRELNEARGQVGDYAVNNARLKAEKTAVEEDRDDYRRQLLESQARCAAHGHAPLR